MNISFGFRVLAVPCAAMLFITAFSFSSMGIQGGKAKQAAQKAEEKLAAAKKALKECEDAKLAALKAHEVADQANADANTATDEATKSQEHADESMPKVGASKTDADKAADKAADDADKAANDADDALDKGEKGAKGKDTAAGKADAESKKADQDAADADKNLDPQVKAAKQDAREQRQDARAKRRKARALQRAAAAADKLAEEKCNHAKDAIKEAEDALQAARDALAYDTNHGAKDTGGVGRRIKKVEDDLDDLKKKAAANSPSPEEPVKSVEPPKAGMVMPPNVATKTTIADGLQTITFDTSAGRLTINLPDDGMAGDTISGTVVAEPKGSNEQERARNQGVLSGYVVEIGNQKVPASTGSFKWNIPIPSPQMQPAYKVTILELSSGKHVSDTPIPVMATITIRGDQGPRLLNDIYYTLPTIGQTGRPIEITGRFDGDSSNTTLRFGPAGSTVQDFEKNTENVSGGFGLMRPLAESPRKTVCEAPTTVTGPIVLNVKEGGAQATGVFRSVGVNLTAPKTSLMKGESTELHVEVNGLQGLTQPVPLTLQSHGVITMVGGNYQPLVIQPSQVGADGTYSTTRGITGVQTGGWTATATVVTHRFDFCLQDDSNPQTVVLVNSFSGNYLFPLPGGTSLSGTGTVTRKGCIINLTDSWPDRNVQSTIDPCTQTGSASVQTSPPNSPKVKFTITDRNTADNVCPAAGLMARPQTSDELLEELEVLRRNKKYDCDHGRLYQKAMAARIAVIKNALRGFHHQKVLNDPIDEDCPPK